MNRFNDFLKSTHPQEPLLPLAHNCETYNFRSIADSGTIETSECNVFKGEYLVYFFYGIPAYRPGDPETVGCRAAIMPTCLLFRPDFGGKPNRIIPFDTGSWHNGLFEMYYNRQMKKEHFFLDCDQKMHARLVARFYGSNIGYFEGIPAPFTVPPAEFEVQCYQDMIMANTKGHDDDRRSAIEIQYNHSIKLINGDVILVVLPSVMLDDAQIRSTIVDNWHSEVRTYDIHRGSPREFIGIIYEKVRDFMKTSGFLT